MPSRPAPSRPDSRVANLLGAVACAVDDAVAEAVNAVGAEVGLSVRDLAALNTVCQWPGGSIGVLAGALGLTHSATVHAVDRLERRGVVERRRAGRGRLVGLFPTAEGVALGRRIAAARLDCLGRLVGELRPADRVRLGRIAEGLLRCAVDSVERGDSACRLCSAGACPAATCPVAAAQAAAGGGGGEA